MEGFFVAKHCVGGEKVLMVMWVEHFFHSHVNLSMEMVV